MAVLDRVPVERIDARARQISPARVVLSLLFLVPFVVGWVLGVAWIALAWLGAAFMEGWDTARGRRGADEGGG